MYIRMMIIPITQILYKKNYLKQKHGKRQLPHCSTINTLKNNVKVLELKTENILYL